MNQRVTVILLIALIIAGIASFMVYRTVTRQARASGTNFQVVVAAHNLDVGTLIKAVDLKMGRWTGEPPKGVPVKKEPLIGRGVVLPIFEGEPVNESRLATAGAGGG